LWETNLVFKKVELPLTKNIRRARFITHQGECRSLRPWEAVRKKVGGKRKKKRKNRLHDL